MNKTSLGKCYYFIKITNTEILIYLRTICNCYQFLVPCPSLTCNLEAKRFFDIMDMEADPCEDFSQFVCGKLYNNDTFPQNYRLSFDTASEKGKYYP